MSAFTTVVTSNRTSRKRPLSNGAVESTAVKRRLGRPAAIYVSGAFSSLPSSLSDSGGKELFADDFRLLIDDAADVGRLPLLL